MAERAAGPEGEDVALVFPAGADWRWWSWRRLAGEATAAAAVAGRVVPYDWWPAPEALAYDLALQAGGAWAAPRSPGFADLVPPAPVPAEAPTGTGGGCLAAPRGALAAADWRRAGERLASLLAATRGRPIGLAGGPLEALPERLWLGALLAAGAGIALAPARADLAAALAWARPHAALLPGALVGELAAGLGALGRPRRLARRLARWRRLLVWGPRDTDAEAALGRLVEVEVVPFPDPLAALRHETAPE